MASSSIPAVSVLSGFAASDPLVWVLGISLVIGSLAVGLLLFARSLRA